MLTQKRTSKPIADLESQVKLTYMSLVGECRLHTERQQPASRVEVFKEKKKKKKKIHITLCGLMSTTLRSLADSIEFWETEE